MPVVRRSVSASFSSVRASASCHASVPAANSPSVGAATSAKDRVPRMSRTVRHRCSAPGTGVARTPPFAGMPCSVYQAMASGDMGAVPTPLNACTRLRFASHRSRGISPPMANDP